MLKLLFSRLKGVSLCAFLSLYLPLVAQNGSLAGRVLSQGAGLELANIYLEGTPFGTSSNAQGYFSLSDIPPGTYTLKVSALGYLAKSTEIVLRPGQKLTQNFNLPKDAFNLSTVVVTGSRNEVERYNSPVIVNTLDAKIFQASQSVNIAEGLNFSPGLRVENNCQNCGFTQLRMNGLDGPYSQVLINSRPVFSALAGVYGLEMLPANMIDRVEVVRGGGSVMYGGNAIAGTVNIITQDPYENSFEVGLNQALINGEASDRTVNFNGSLVSDDLNSGISLFGLNRNRDYWDANGDGFSEIVKLQNTTIGFDAFHKFNPRNKLKLGAYYINEYRRGGNKFDLFPHQTDLTEELQHNILSSNLSFDHLSANRKHKFSAYASLQRVERASYYGGGGRVLSPGDSLSEADLLAINAYGQSEDLSSVTGLQYHYYLNRIFTLTAGSEYSYNSVQDEMPGYGRLIDQTVGTWGNFVELEIKPNEKLSILAGARLDRLRINGLYNLAEEQLRNEESFPVVVPRLSAMYKLQDNLKIRASFAQGYRGPQAFDEDLHIETVGGAARFIRIDPNIELERSNSATLSLNYDRFIGRMQINLVVEGFYTELNNPFIFANQTELPSGVAVVTKRNGSGARVSGLNLEANIALGEKLVLQSGATLQQARYDQAEEIWAPEPADGAEATVTRRLLRNPNHYGFFSLRYTPLQNWEFNYSGVITGSMDVAHVIDPETERTVIKSTPSFFENNVKVNYRFKSSSNLVVQVFGGIQNIFNSYQRDFDLGAERDAGYVYGPLRPRTFFAGLRFGL